MNIRWFRWTIVIAIICTAVLAAGLRLSRVEPDAVSAASAVAVKNASLEMQATSLAEVEARQLQVGARQAQAAVQPIALFEDEAAGYHINYPVEWEMFQLSDRVALFQSLDGVTRVKVEDVGPLPADGLAPFVERSLYNDTVLSRQLLTVHGYPAERVVAFADSPGGQKTTFFIETDTSVFVITGIGQQRMIEQVARSFNAPQVVAQR